MAFPINPIQGTTYDNNGRMWSFNGYAWDRIQVTGGGGIVGNYVSTFNGLTGDVVFGINIDGGTY
jgi:hypothetical protein